MFDPIDAKCFPFDSQDFKVDLRLFRDSHRIMRKFVHGFTRWNHGGEWHGRINSDPVSGWEVDGCVGKKSATFLFTPPILILGVKISDGVDWSAKVTFTIVCSRHSVFYNLNLNLLMFLFNVLTVFSYAYPAIENAPERGVIPFCY